jgi:tetratricopeptide (TPR) repeat protein
MNFLQASSQEWRDLRNSIASGTLRPGLFTVLGHSEEIAVQAQSILEDTFQPGYHVKYFLCSGSGMFRLPCFRPFSPKEVTPESLLALPFLTGAAFTRESFVKEALSEALEELAQTAIRTSQLPQLILVEYLTPPAWYDLSFTVSLLRSEVSQYIPIVLLVHQSSDRDCLLWQRCDTIESILIMLYLCAGRIRQADWQKIRNQMQESSIYDRFIASRRVGSDSWICYANRQVAEMAERAFQTAEEARKREIASNVLQILPCSTGYPLLAIASETDDLTAMLSIYSQEAVNAALCEPGGLVRYFDSVQKMAQRAGDSTLMDMAYLSHLSSQFLLGGDRSTQIYERLQEIALPGNVDKETQGFFWNILGQQFVKMQRPEDWRYAADCFRLGRECFQCVEQEDQLRVRMGLALIANGEALIAYKRGQGEKARQLEEFALAKSKDLVLATNFQVHARINLGDVLLRSLGDREAALTRYGEALFEISQIRKKFRLQILPRRLAANRQIAALKLGSTFVQAERCHEAIDFLEYFLSSSKKDAGANTFGEESRILAFKTRLALAQAYLKTGQQRKAAASYWQILRHPQWLEPAALREVIAKLRECQPAIGEPLQKRTERIVSKQEAIIADTVRIQEVLTAIQADQNA